MRQFLPILLAACVQVVPGEPIPLTDPTAWVFVRDAEDPFAAEGDVDAFCDPGGFGAAEIAGKLSWDVNTDYCPRLTVAQPAAATIRSGDLVAIRLYHFDLIAPESAEAVFALALDGREVWRDTRGIPGPAGLVLGEFQAPRRVPEGAQIALHIRNHGANNYHLLDLVVRPLEPTP